MRAFFAFNSTHNQYASEQYQYFLRKKLKLKLKKTGGNMSNKDAYWNKTKNHMIVTLVIWAFFSLVIFMFGSELNTMSFLGYPLAYYMTAQGSLLAFVVMLFWTANKQEKIDEEHGFSEREED